MLTGSCLLDQMMRPKLLRCKRQQNIACSFSIRAQDDQRVRPPLISGRRGFRGPATTFRAKVSTLLKPALTFWHRVSSKVPVGLNPFTGSVRSSRAPPVARLVFAFPGRRRSGSLRRRNAWLLSFKYVFDGCNTRQYGCSTSSWHLLEASLLVF